MIDTDVVLEIFLGRRSSLISQLFLRFVRAIRKKSNMVLGTGCSPPFSPSFPSSSSPTANASFPSPRTVHGSSANLSFTAMVVLDSSTELSREVNKSVKSCNRAQSRPSLHSRRPRFCPEGLHVVAKKCKPVEYDDISMLSRPPASVIDERIQLDSGHEARKRPAKIIIPKFRIGADDEIIENSGCVEVEAGTKYFVACRKGIRRKNMEDRYAVITDIADNSKQAFFAVLDGHGGHEAVDFIADRLGVNMVGTMKNMMEEDNNEDILETATKVGYKTTDEEIVAKGLRGGACAATVLIKDGEAQIANVGDCRVVVSRDCIAQALTNDHRVDSHDERSRIENLGGYVNVHNGVWRVHGSLAVSRAIGDSHLKKWVISEPHTIKVRLTPESQFLIIASDGLWDKVTNQEAVNEVLTKGRLSIESCRRLVELACSRGNLDDITIMLVDLGSFVM